MIVRTNRMKQDNKFLEAGQILTHNPSGSRWIIVDSNPYHGRKTREGYIRMVKAYCIYSGSKPNYWQPGQLDDWVLNKKDLAIGDTVWTIG
jgi:hypothetical protein